MPARQKILVVDNNPDLLIVLEKFLEDAGFETTVTWDDRKALACIESQAFAAVVVGGHPPSVRCLEVVRRLRLKQDKTVCIVLDGPECEAERNELHAMTVSAIISKWNLKEVVDTIRAATGSKKASAAVA